MNRQTNSQEPFASILSPTYPRSTPKAQISQIVTGFAREQQKSMASISERCSATEYVIANIQVLVSKLGERAQHLTREKESELLGNLKMKQNQFIINELKGSLTKQLKKEERLSEELDCERTKVDKFREEVFKLEAKNHSLADKANQCEYIIREKEDEIDKLSRRMLRQKQESENENRSRVKFNQSSETGANEYLAQFETKIEELERQLETKISTLQNKNHDQNVSLKRLHEQLEEERSLSKTHKRQLDEANISKYEFEIKLRQATQETSQLEDSHQKLLEKSKNTEITLHKQIQDMKTKEVGLRNDYKKEKKNFKQFLSTIAEFINNNSKYYLIGNTLSEQVEEIKKLFDKTVKKKTEQQNREAVYYQAEWKKLKTKNEEIEMSLSQLEKKEKKEIVKVLSQKEVERYEMSDKSEGGNSFVNRSTDRSEEDKHRNEEKYKTKLEVFRKDLKVKQTRINELEKLQQVEFDKSKERILQLEFSLSEKGNQLRKFELKYKEKDYELNEFKGTIRELESKAVYLTEKIENEKESSGKILEMKVQNYEEKIKNIKTVHKELERKEQEKTIKYNKLKSKYQKYDVEASQSLKRKNLQLDQLLKENSRMKTENKLLEEKININNIIEKEINANKTPLPVNQDLIEQIEMERDRISSELMEKQRQCSEIIESNTKMSSQMLMLKRELRQTRSKLEDLGKEYRYLQEENSFAKEKIEELKGKKNEQEEESHSYFKKELEKNISNMKKLEATCEKQSSQKKKMKKEIEDLSSEMTSCRHTIEKLKDKNARLSDEVLDQKLINKREKTEFEIRISECNTKQAQLVDIINYKNKETGHIRESMKGEELLPNFELKVSKVSKETTTKDLMQLVNTSMNTDQLAEEPAKPEGMNAIIPSEMFFNEEDELEDMLLESEMGQKVIAPVEEVKEVKGSAKEVNYFNNEELEMEGEELDHHFDICDEDDQVNINKVSLKLEIKQAFNCIRRVIEKIFNEEDVEIEEIKVLPRQLEDDFNDFIGYIKEKIFQIKGENNLSFIMAEVGDEPELIEEELVNFLSESQPEYMRLRKIIEEKEYMISGLMTEKTQQQNTINQMTEQKEEMEEESENRFMNQCTVYKKEIKEYKKLIDILEMTCQSLKNIFKNTLDLWVDENDNEDDIKDNLVLFTTICKLNDNDKRKLNGYLDKYRVMRGLN